MQLHEIKPKIKSKNKKRVGRGGKRGTYSGRGSKGQKAHAGRRIKSQVMNLIQRLPKLRGFKNKPLYEKPAVINVGDLEKKINGGAINREILIKAGIFRNSVKRIKILGGGEITKSFQIKGLEVSDGAKKKIESAGGKINE